MMLPSQLRPGQPQMSAAAQQGLMHRPAAAPGVNPLAMYPGMNLQVSADATVCWLNAFELTPLCVFLMNWTNFMHSIATWRVWHSVV